MMNQARFGAQRQMMGGNMRGGAGGPQNPLDLLSNLVRPHQSRSAGFGFGSDDRIDQGYMAQG